MDGEGRVKQEARTEGGGCRTYMDVFTARLEKPGTIAAGLQSTIIF